MISQLLDKYRIVKKKKELEQIFKQKIEWKYFQFIYYAYFQIIDLKKICNVNFTIKNSKVHIEIDQFSLIVNSTEEFLILKEIFVDGIYNFKHTSAYIFIDIGMNVGFTSLYVAKNDFCKNVISFEPFSDTINYADQNFKLNKIISNKILTHNYGLGYPERNLNVDFNPIWKGSVGINGLAKYINQKDSFCKKELLIKDVAKELEKIIDGKHDIVIKIDCEGAEYEILERLYETDLIKQVSLFMIEWHLKGPASIEKIMKSSGFSCVSIFPNGPNTGMIYACRNA